MFRKVFLALGLLLLVCSTSFAQNSTTVSGTITDGGGQAWLNGTFNFVFVPSATNPVGPYVWTGGTLPTNIGGSLSGTGTYSVSIPSNTAISPIQTAWTATFCPQASSPCFTVSNITITGATQTLNATPPTILINLQSAQPPVLAYTNSEISGAALGSQYFNLVSGTLQTCTAISGNNCTTWSSAGTATNATNLVGPGAITGTFSGTHTETGNVTFSGPLNSTGSFNGSNINGTFWVCPVPCIYTTLAPALTAAVAVGGGLIFDMVPETFTTNPMAVVPVTATVTIQFGNGVWATNQQIDLPQFSRMIGAGEWNGTGGTAIRANPAAFPSQTITTCTESSFTATCNVTSTTNIAVNSMVSITGSSVSGYNQSCIATTVTTNTIQCLVKTSGLGTGNGGTLSAAIIRIGRDNQTHGAFVAEMTLDCQNLASACSGISSSDANEYSGARDISIQNFSGYGIDIESTVGGSAQNNYWQNIEITPNNGGNSNTIGFRYVGNGGGCPADIFNVNVVGTPGHVIDRGFLLANCVGGVGSDMHTEYAANAGVQLGDVTLGAAGNFVLNYPTYGNGSGTTNVLINNTSTTNITVLSASKGTATNDIVDNSNTGTSTEAAVAYYSFGQGSVGARQIITSSAQLQNTTYATTHIGADNFKPGFYLTETTALTSGANLATCYADSTAHWLECSMNNGTFGKVVLENATETLTNKTLTSPVVNGSTGVGTLRASLHISDQGTACANGNIVLSAGWGTTATTTAAAGQGQTCQFTLTSSGTGQAATPTITDTLPIALPSASVVCTAQMVGGTGANTLINQTTLSATAPVFTFAGTPGAASTYFVVIRCGP